MVFVCLTFPPAAVYHTSKMHSHGEVYGSQQSLRNNQDTQRGEWKVGEMSEEVGRRMTGGAERRRRVQADVGRQDLGA